MYKLKRIEKDSIKSALLMLGFCLVPVLLIAVTDIGSLSMVVGFFLVPAVGVAAWLVYCVAHNKWGGIPFDEKGFTVGKRTYLYTEVDRVDVVKTTPRRTAMRVDYTVVVDGERVLRYQLTHENADLFCAFLKKAEVPFEYQEGFRV